MSISQEVWQRVEPRVVAALEQLKASRKATSGDEIRFSLVMALIMSLLLFSLIYAMKIGDTEPLTIFAISVIVSIITSLIIVKNIYRNRRNKKYKAEVIPTLLDAICPGATFEPKGTLTKEMIGASKLFDTGWGEKFTNEDSIRGKVGKTDFVYGEVELYHIQSTGKSAVKVVDFKGFVFEADFNKYFQGLTMLSSQRMRLATTVGLFSSLERIHLEDPNFDEQYRTYTTNDQEARYILTPALQQRILELNRIFGQELGDREINISFHDDRMLIMVPSQTNRFELKYDVEGVKKDFLALTLMIDIIEQLTLNLRIWTKE